MAARVGLNLNFEFRFFKVNQFKFFKIRKKSMDPTLTVTLYGFCLGLDKSVAYLVGSPQNVRLFTLPFYLETEKGFYSSLVFL